MNKTDLVKALGNFVVERYEKIQAKIGSEHGILPDFWCDIVVEDYEEWAEEASAIMTLSRAVSVLDDLKDIED